MGLQVCTSTAGVVSLRRLLPAATWFGGDEIGVRGCACDSRRVEPGVLFAALPGSRRDGHDFIAQAVSRGCSAILSQRPVPEFGLPNCVVADTRDAYGRVCQALAGNPSHRLKLIGVTGADGKAATSCLLASVLAGAGNRVGMLGGLGYFDGDALEPASWTTPPAAPLADWLTRMVLNGCSHAVMEVSGQALDQSRVAGVRFDAACVTNVSRDHLDYRTTVRDYRLARSKLFEHLAPEGFAVINADDPVAAGILGRLDGPALTVGIRAAAEIAATPLEEFSSQQTFLLTAGSETIPVQTHMIGRQHVYNCLTAAAVGLAYGIDLPTVVRGLEAVECVPGRLQRIECGQPFGVFVDFARTPDALTDCLTTLRQVSGGRLICVFGAGGDRDRRKRPLLGRAAERGADLAVVTSDNPRSEDPRAIAAEILQGFENPAAAQVVLDRAEAIHRALAQAAPGDCVLIAGKGHQTYQIIGQRRFPWDDCEAARQWLYEVKPYSEGGWGKAEGGRKTANH